MSADANHDPPLGPEEAELARLADGTIAPDRRAVLEARIAASPELAARLAEQRRAVDLVAEVAPPAPESLRRRIEADRRQAAPVVRRRRYGLGLGLAVAAAAAAIAAVFLLPSGVPGGTVIADAAELQAQPSTAPPPPPASRTLLDLTASGVQFPRYAGKFGWRAVGRRSDRLHGRDAVTVFYAKNGHRIGYTVLSGGVLHPPADSRHRRVEGTLVSSFDHEGRTVTTWVRQGRTCVMSGVGVPRPTLYKLSGWKGKGTVPF
jgi:hypothetical protein